MLTLLGNPEEKIDPVGRFIIHAEAGTNAFHDAVHGFKVFNLPIYAESVKGDFILTAKVEPSFKSLFDAGCLVAYESQERWMKCALEDTDNGYPALVAVINNGYSDDTSGERVDLSSVWLRLVRKGDNWAMHFSKDGKDWKMFRYFRLPMAQEIMVGVTAQSPTGQGSDCAFEGFSLVTGSFQNMRKGD
jgi:regulation of enolase protein 1 (concanavalin A-like superfamily)